MKIIRLWSAIYHVRVIWRWIIRDLEIWLEVTQGHWNLCYSKAWVQFLFAFYSNNRYVSLPVGESFVKNRKKNYTPHVTTPTMTGTWRTDGQADGQTDRQTDKQTELLSRVRSKCIVRRNCGRLLNQLQTNTKQLTVVPDSGRTVSKATTKLYAYVEFYLYPTVGTVLIHSVKPELTE